MIDCDDIIDRFHQLTREQVGLAVIAAAPQVAALHLDLALFGAEQARYAEELCDDG